MYRGRKSHTRCGVKGRITAATVMVVAAVVAVVETAAATEAAAAVAAAVAASAVAEEAGELKPGRTKEAGALQQKD